MIHIFSNSDTIQETPDYKSIVVTQYPLRQIFTYIKSLPSDDFIIMLPSNFILDGNIIYQIIESFINSEYPIIAIDPDNIDKRLDVFNLNKLYNDDIIIFQRKSMRSGLTDISPTSTYDKIKQKIVRLCGGGSIKAPYDRFDPPTETVYARTSQSIDIIPYSKPIYKVTINMGIGDMIHARGILDAQKQNFKNVYISPNMNSYTTARQPKPEHIQFTQKLFEYLFKDPYYIIHPPNSPFPQRSEFLFHSLDNLPLIKPELSDELCEGKRLNIGKYIVISTRVRDIPRKEYNELIKPRFLEILKLLSDEYKIVLIGERHLVKYLEHDILLNRDTMFLLYDDIINNISDDKIIDLTFDNVDELHDDHFTRLKQECLYMRNAVWNITFGIGGSFCMATAVGNVVGYCSSHTVLGGNTISQLYDNNKYQNIKISTNLNVFFENLMNIVENKLIFSARINLGIGDIIYTKTILDNNMSKYNKISLCPNKFLLDTYRNSDINHYNFCKDFIYLLFDNSIYEINDDQTYPETPTHYLYTKYDMIPKKPELHSYLCDNNFILPNGLVENEYIVITTKVRATKKSTFDKLVKSGFWYNMKLLSNKYKIVVIGERDIDINDEYKLIPDSIFTIYDDIIKYIGKENIIDLSIPSFNDVTSSIESIKIDCTIMSKALYVMSIGIGGNFCMSTAVAKNTLCFFDDNNFPIIDYLYKTHKNENPSVFITDDIREFNTKIMEIGGIIKGEYKGCLYLGIGTLIYIKAMLDNVKHLYDKIYIAPRKELLDLIHPGRQDWVKFKDDILKLFFSEYPYIITNNQQYPKKDIVHIYNDGVPVVIPDLKEYLCIGTLPEELVNKEYIVISTKIRLLYRDFYKKAINTGLWTSLSKLSNKYKLVIIGEREVERNFEYMQEVVKDNVYSIYTDLMNNIPHENVIDLTMPAWGLSEPSLPRLQNDCVILENAKYSITLGVGGNFCMSTAVAKTIGLDDPKNPDVVAKKLYGNNNINDRVWVTRDIQKFINRLNEL